MRSMGRCAAGFPRAACSGEHLPRHRYTVISWPPYSLRSVEYVPELPRNAPGKVLKTVVSRAATTRRARLCGPGVL